MSGASAGFEVIAAFNSEQNARAAIASLRHANIAAAAISLKRDATLHAPPPEAPTLGKVFWSGLWWSVVGGAVGVVMGLIVGLAGWGIPGTPDNVALQIASWAMFWHVLGALIGCYLVLDTGDRFARKPDHHDATQILVRLHTGDAEVASLGEGILVSAGGELRTNTGPSGSTPV